ncbi:hypothetical protein [Bradyrhizobium elkanii]|uniref:hypothetical protein n=1 Tax=Bradyrhizobium elkanii TaxID=29448 RepID=UPI001BA78850|nr:hypothetical protein [Bradyrhizobium elkanii]MBR1164939.1 hypothetical protein [Bradyrhizobium elkanii]
MKMVPLLLSGLVGLCFPWERVYACQTAATAEPRQKLDLTGLQDKTTDRAANFVVIYGGCIMRTAESARSDRDTDPPEAVLQSQSFAFYALSRGNGLSDEGRRLLEVFRELLRRMKAEGQIVQVSDSRFGLEGETRICAEFVSSDSASKAWMQMQRLSAGVDLVQLKPEKC